MGKKKKMNEINASMNPNDNDNPCIFVRNIDYTLKSLELQQQFEEIAPVKRAYCIPSKTRDKRIYNAGYGFVEFASIEDANLAIQKFHKRIVNGRRLRVDLALKKGVKPLNVDQKKQNKKSTLLQMQDNNNNDKRRQANILRRSESTNTLLLSKINTEITKTELINLIKSKIQEDNIENSRIYEYIYYPSPESSKFSYCARLIYKTKEHATLALNDLDGIIIKTGTNTIKARYLNDKASRLIIRNLPFNITKTDLMNTFQSYGIVNDCHITQDINGNNLGFGFIQYNNIIEAAQAIQGCNGIYINKRQIAVDWALAKDTYKNRLMEIVDQEGTKGDQLLQKLPQKDIEEEEEEEQIIDTEHEINIDQSSN